MSRGHRLDESAEGKSEEELQRVLGEGDTPDLYAKEPGPPNTEHTVGYGGGISVDGRTPYIDRQLYREIMDGKVKVKGMTAEQIVQEIVFHEHTEKTISSGDNAVDVYQPCHEFAITNGRRFVRRLGADPEEEDEALRPALARCLRREQNDPPKDLWCGPYLDHADARDKEIIAQFKAHGVADAFKTSKFDVHYGYGPEQCQHCQHFCSGKGPLRKCELISGLVRNTRWCDWWQRA